MKKTVILTIFLFLSVITVFAESNLLSISPVEFPTQSIANDSYTPSDKDTVIILNDDTVQITGDGAVWETDTVTISKCGSYYLTGSFAGQIVINSPDEDKVSLTLNGVNLNGMNSTPLLALSAGKNVTISLVKNSTNIISCAFIEDALGTDGAYDAALFSKADLKLKGDGDIYITCQGGKGINCRDDIEIQSGNLYISATDDGMRGKDSVSISGGHIYISAGADGIRSSNEEKEGKGYISLSGGDITIEASLDAVQAYNTLTVSGGKLQIKSGGGAQEAAIIRKDDMARGRGGGKGWDMDERSRSTNETTESTKGLKSTTSIVVSGGMITADCKDDALHSDLDITINGGQMNLASGDDGIHAENALYIQGGSILISQSYEGVEASDLQISGGETRLFASDDGINAAGGEKDATGFGNYGGPGRRGGMGMLSATSGMFQMSGGYVLVNCDGDGIDVNGNAEMTSGLIIVYGPTNGGNGALDYDGSFTVTGGTLLATGSAGMAQAVSAGQMLAFTCSIPAETLLHIQDEAGNDILTFQSPKSYSCVVFSSDMLTEGGGYEVYAEGSYSTEPFDGYFLNGTYTPGTLLGTLKQ